MVDSIKKTQLQFTPGQPLDAKLRRLVDEIVRTQDTLNQLIDDVNSIATGGGSVIAVHELASESGLGPEHAVAGLIEGHVLKAFGDTDAHFGLLQLQELARTDWTGGENQGDVLFFTGGYWTPVAFEDIFGSGNPGVDSVFGWSVTAAANIYRIAGPGIGLDDGSIFVKPEEISHGALAGLDADDHPQYAAIAQNEDITGSWIFHNPISFLSTTYFGDTMTQEDDSPEQNIIDDGSDADEGHWAVQAFPGMIQYQTRFDDGTVGEAWMSVQRAGAIVTAIDFQGDRLAFNGDAVTTEVELALNALDSDDLSYFMAVQ